MTSGRAGSGSNIGSKCKDCTEILDHDNCVFKGSYMQPRCKSCFNKHHNANPSRQKEARAANYLEWKWNLTSEQYKKKLDLQLGGCAICKQPDITNKALAVDHDHKTNVIRDLLCYRCNQVLGMVFEDEMILFAMIEYLKKHGEKAS